MIDEQKAKEEQAKQIGQKVWLSNPEIEKLREAKRVVDSSIHPDTQQINPIPMRLCAFVPMNLPINYGFILAPPTTANTIFWQWIN